MQSIIIDRRARRFSWVIAIVLSFCCYQIASGDLLQTFRSEYPAAAAKLEEAYSHVRLLAKGTGTDSSGKWIMNSDIEILRENNLVRWTLTTTKSALPAVPAGSISVMGGDQKLFFEMFKTPTDTAWKFYWHGPMPDFDSTVRRDFLALYAPFCIQGKTVTEYLNQHGLRIVSATMAKLDGHDVVEVTTEQTMPPLRTPYGTMEDCGVFRTRLYFIPGSWALAGWTRFSGDKMPKNEQTVWQQRADYQPNTDPPKLSHIKAWEEFNSDVWKDNPKLLAFKFSERAETVISLKFGPVPVSEFTPAAAGAN